MNTRGGTLPVALLCVLVFAFLAATSVALMRAQVRETLYEARLAQAHAIAEAGIEEALNKLTLAPSWRDGWVERPFGGGAYTVTLSTDAAPWVESTGYAAAIPGLGRPARTIRAQAVFDGFYNFADSTFTVTWQTTAFDSAVDYSPTCASNKMTSNGCRSGDHVWANTAVVTTPGDIRIHGDATYATATSTPPAASTVSGEVRLAASSVTVPVEDGTPYVAVNDNGRLPASAYDSSTKRLHVTSTMTVTLSSGVYHLRGISSSGTINVSLGDPSEELAIYLDGDLWVGGARGRIASNNGCGGNGGGCRAYNVHVYGQEAGGTVWLGGFEQTAKNENETYLDVFCPRHEVTLNQRLLGRLVGRSVRVQNPYGGGNKYPVFFFDLQFGFASSDGVRWARGSWSEDYGRQ